MYKIIEKLAWVTGSLSLAGVILILFFQGNGSSENQKEEVPLKRPVIKLSASRPFTRKTETPTIIKSETTKPEQTKQEAERPKVIESKKVLAPAEPAPKPKEKERKPVARPDPEVIYANAASSGRLFAESELDQLIGKIQAENIRRNSEANCIQIRITADNNNTQAVAQVERFLSARNYIITGREKEDFLRGSGLKVYAQGKCLKVTIGIK